MYVDPFINANVDDHQQPPPDPHRTQHLLDGAAMPCHAMPCHAMSLLESSYFCRSTPVSASQVAN